MKSAHRNRLAATLAAFAVTAALAGPGSAAHTSTPSQPLDWPERWAAAHPTATGNPGSLLATARATATAIPDWPERWAAAHPGGLHIVRLAPAASRGSASEPRDWPERSAAARS